MSWLPLMLALSCKSLLADERWLARAERIESRRLTHCDGPRSCARYIEALTDIHERQAARTEAWVAKECGGPMGST